MKLIVTKFGGTSVGTIDRIKSVAKRIKNEVNNSSLKLSYNDIIKGAPTSSQNQIDSLLSQSAINISIDYNNFSDYIYF